eukprot:TRINITY_DN8375_c0_g1_i1.p1 TRINITY_DN8375_c0_g1~~TRINITY_DN8375_c0_g1_i1.p1  ORF type:complete len:387 (+),score=84.39 TRINITY_DN8375_c0_g1_i1:291-1451(+)
MIENKTIVQSSQEDSMGLFDILVSPAIILIFQQTSKKDKLSFASTCKKAFTYVLKTKEMLFQPQVVYPREKDYFHRGSTTHLIHLPNEWDSISYNSEHFNQIQTVISISQGINTLELVNWSLVHQKEFVLLPNLTKLVFVNISGYFYLGRSDHKIGTQCILAVTTLKTFFPNLTDLTCDYLEVNINNHQTFPILPNIQHLNFVALLNEEHMIDTCGGKDYQWLMLRRLHNLDKVFSPQLLTTIEVRDPVLVPDCLYYVEKGRIDSGWFACQVSDIWNDLKVFKKLKKICSEAVLLPSLEDLSLFPELTHIQIGDPQWLESDATLNEHIQYLQQNISQVNPNLSQISTYKKFFDWPTSKQISHKFQKIELQGIVHYRGFPITQTRRR